MESYLFAAHDALDFILLADEFRIGLSHDFVERGQQFVHERLHQAQLAPVADGAAQNAADDVAAAFVGGQSAVGDGEGHHAQVVGADAHGDGSFIVGYAFDVSLAGHLG